MPPSKRDELVEAAMNVFCRHGFHASGIESILNAGGISRMTIYNHFKSKDELVIAAMRRRDEIFRNRMMKFVEAHARTPLERVLAVFDFHRAWFEDPEFSGCMFINAAAEYADPHSAARQLAAEHKRLICQYLREQCAAAGVPDADRVAEQLNLLLDGAIVTAHVIERPKGANPSPGRAADLARALAERVLAATASAPAAAPSH